MALSKIQSESMNLADNFAFTGTVSGAGASITTNTWTPYYSSGGATTAYESDIFTSASYATQFGTYTRIGDMVFANANVIIDHSAAGYQNGGAISQTVTMSGLPFRVKNTSQYYPMTSTMYFSVDTTQGWGSYNLVGFGTFNEKYMFINFTSAGGTTSSFLTSNVYSGVSHDSQVILSIAYETDEA